MSDSIIDVQTRSSEVSSMSSGPRRPSCLWQRHVLAGPGSGLTSRRMSGGPSRTSPQVSAVCSALTSLYSSLAFIPRNPVERGPMLYNDLPPLWIFGF